MIATVSASSRAKSRYCSTSTIASPSFSLKKTIARPRLLVLDEPTEGIQPSIIKDIERAIRTLAGTGEMAILLVEQYFDFARSLADHYMIMERGEVIARGKGADMNESVRALLAV